MNGYFFVSYSPDKSMHTMLHSEFDEKEFAYYETRESALEDVNRMNEIIKMELEPIKVSKEFLDNVHKIVDTDSK